jgi:PHD and RING finger domain-containing protein 1
VIEEMKTFLKPYYTRRQLTKDQYKDIMRHAVPRICHGRPSTGDISASRIHKYAKTYIDKALKSKQQLDKK